MSILAMAGIIKLREQQQYLYMEHPTVDMDSLP